MILLGIFINIYMYIMVEKRLQIRLGFRVGGPVSWDQWRIKSERTRRIKCNLGLYCGLYSTCGGSQCWAQKLCEAGYGLASARKVEICCRACAYIYIHIYLRILYTLGVFSLHVQSFCARSFRGFEGFDEDGKRRRLIGAVSMSCILIRLLPSN